MMAIINILVIMVFGISLLGASSSVSASTSSSNDTLEEKYEDIEWYEDCSETYPYGKEGTPLQTDQRIKDLPAIINSTEDEEEKEALQEELECLDFIRTNEIEGMNSFMKDVGEPLGEAFEMVELYNERKDIDNRLNELINK